MSTERIQNLEQHSDTKIREIITEHPKVFPEGGRPDDSEIEQSKNDLGKIFKQFKEMKFNFGDIGQEKTKIAKLKKEFEESYKNLHKKTIENQEIINPKSVEEIREKFEKLASLMIVGRVIFQLKIWNCDLTEDEIRENLQTNMYYGELNFRINSQGELERTCYFDWIGKKLPKVEKFENQEDEEKNSKNKKKYLRKALKLAIQLTNAHFFGIVKTRKQIDEFKENKQEEIRKENERKSQNSTQNIGQNSTNPNELYFCRNS